MRARGLGLLLLFAGLLVWLRWMAGAPTLPLAPPGPGAAGPDAVRPAPGSAPTFAAHVVSLPAESEAGDETFAIAPRPHAEASASAAPPPSYEPAARADAERAHDAELAVLEEEASRAALRRGLAPPPADVRAGPDRPAARALGQAAAVPADRDATRRSLSDELLVDHLVADTYRTTLFPPELDAVAESRAAARSLLAAIPVAERRELLRAALDAEAPTLRPVYQPLPGATAE